MKVLLVACAGAHLHDVARALEKRGALAGLWVSTKNRTGVSPEHYRRAWIFHLAAKPIYHLASPSVIERVYHGLFPLWGAWVRRQRLPPCDAIHAIMGYGSEPFDLTKNSPTLKVIDGSSSHPTSFFGFWQRECDLFCPGARVGIPRWLFARANRELERADMISCASVFVRDSMLYNGIAATKCVVNPYGVDTSVFKPRTSVPQRPRFVCVGGIGLRKGHQYLFRAFEKVRGALPEAELICAGEYHADFKRERSRWAGMFTHHAGLRHDELAALLGECTAFVLPSNEEGFARAIIEAMSAGLPIIASYQSGATTLVRDGVEGLIVNGRDVNQLASAMVRVASDRGLNESMGKAATARGGQKNSWDDYAGRLLEIYSEALAKMPSRRSDNVTCAVA